MTEDKSISKIMSRFNNIENKDNDFISEELYYARCTLSDINLDDEVHHFYSLGIDKICENSWESDLANNISKILRCEYIISKRNKNNQIEKFDYCFIFIGLGFDPKVASLIFNKIYSVVIYKCQLYLEEILLDLKNKKFNEEEFLIKNNNLIEDRLNDFCKFLVEDISCFSDFLNHNKIYEFRRFS